jgi:hypothetical protein
MSKKPETGTILFEVALLTIVVFLVDEWLIRGALAFIPAMLLAQRALNTAKVPEGWAPADQGSPAAMKGPIEKLLGVFREFYSTGHLLGSGGISSDEAHQRTMDLEKDLNRLLDEVTAIAPAAVGASGPVGTSAVPITQGMAMASPAAAAAPSEESSSEVTPEPAAGLPTL